MEAAPLSLAYSHARNAAAEQQKANSIAASEEHDLAAGEFANAAKIAGDPEALRTLRLLEQHHQRLAELLKFKPGPVAAADNAEAEATPQVLATVAEVGTGQKLEEKASNASRQTARVSERAHRELSSSIASNLASARGIQPRQRPRSSQPSTTLSTTTADGRMSKDAEAHAGAEQIQTSRRTSRGYDRRPPPLSPSSTFKARPSVADASKVSPTRTQIPPSVLQSGSDDAFTRFYSTVESLGTKLSAALAFTGLPLGASENEEVPSTAEASPYHASEKPAKQPRQQGSKPPTLSRDTSRTTPSGSPDVSRFFSRAALKAVRDETGGAGVAESFYVVPTSGGTVSYRDMLSTAGQQNRQSSGLSNVDEAEEFVDAHEVPGTASFEGSKTPRNNRSRANTTRSRPGTSDGKAQQEVVNELNHWKALAMETGERLRAFEMNAQRESIMHASMFRPHGPGSPMSSMKRESTKSSSEERAKVQELEGRLSEVQAAMDKEVEEVHRLTKENKKLEAVLLKYRKKFDELKDSARERIKREEEGKARANAGASVVE